MLVKNFHPHRLPSGSIGATFQVEHEDAVYPTVLEWSLKDAAYINKLLAQMIMEDIKDDA